jgi:hypothetical protein
MRLLDKEKNKQITASFPAFPHNIAAFGVLAVICLFFSLAGVTPAFAEKLPFGIESLEISATNQNGTPDVEAGSHPYLLTTSFTLNPAEAITGPSFPHEEDFVVRGHGLKDVRFEAPPGFVGNPNATPKCSYQAFVENRNGAASACPNDTAVGEATTTLSGALSEEFGGQLFDEYIVVTDPVYNLETPGAVAAEFGFKVDGAVPIFLDASVRTGSDYGVSVDVKIPQTDSVLASTVKIWGVPADPNHNAVRGSCLGKDESVSAEIRAGNTHSEGVEGPEGCAVDVPVVPLLTNPTSCGVPRTATLKVDDWEQPGNFATEPGDLPGEKVHAMHASLPELSGCEDLDFSPTLDVTPDGSAGSTPTGLNVAVHVPQESTENPEGKGEADVKDTTVTLPAGVQLSPSASDGLQACSNAQIGFEGDKELDQSGTQTAVFSPEKPSCPDASKIATVHIATPLLEHELEGEVYLAAPQNFSGLPENPFSSLIAMYLVAEEPEHGVLVKLPGRVSLCEAAGQVLEGVSCQGPGQIVTTFENTPELPFSDLKLEFFGTDRAPLATPALCGTYTTQSSFTPWTSPESGAPKHPSSSFQITSGPATASYPNGSPCPGASLPFSPSLASGSTNINAGSFSNLTTTLSREDGQQSIQQVTLHYPPGLTGSLAGVELCPEAQANAGTCGPNSQIGETIVSVGLGNDPFSVTGGKVYLTQKIAGSPPDDPFGLSIVNPAKAGPFDLQEGRPVVVRATIEVNPTTAALTVTTNGASQPYHIPTMIEGIPLQIKHVNVLINRPGFTFNPTSCNPTKVTGAVTSAEGATSPVEDAFQVTNCAQLKFEPKIAVSTQGKTSKADGASLTYKVTYPYGPQGTYANIHYVKVELPEQLPSRLTTLQKACTQKQFTENPAGCPGPSLIGHAKAVVPNIPVPLEGPVYFVSNGGEAFPNLVMVLQGYGVTIDLVGDTLIKNGVTSTTFNQVPDNPVTSFEITLPEGPYSALAANGNLCQQSLQMPNEYISQAGQPVKFTAPVAVEGCAPTIYVTKHSVKGKVATIQVHVPAAGKLVATGKGLSKASKSSKAATTLTVKLTLSSKEQAFLAKHHAKRLKAKIGLTFAPKKGSKLKTSVTVYIG